jgi:hypothetical protein
LGPESGFPTLHHICTTIGGSLAEQVVELGGDRTINAFGE